MIDIHPPHHAAITRRDFFIHLFIVILGILIAIGLEQTVEAIHHRHQRHQVEHDLRTEAEKNLRLIDLDYKFYDNQLAALSALHQHVETLRASRGKHLPASTQPAPALPSPLYWFPLASAWHTAKESSEIALLPREEAAMFDDLYFQNDRMSTFADKYFDALNEQRRFESRFKDRNSAGTSADAPSSLANMNAEDLKQYAGLISDSIEALQTSRFLTDLARNSSRSVLNGATSADELENHLGDNTTYANSN